MDYIKHYDPSRIDTSVRVPETWMTDYLIFLSSVRSYHPRTIHRILSTLSAFYRFLRAQKVMDSNPLETIDRPKVTRREIIYLKHREVLELLASIPNMRDRLLVRTIYATGVRVSELTGMRIEDIDFNQQTIRVTGKGGKVRVVFLDRGTLEMIHASLGDRKEGPLFPGQMGRAITPRTIQLIFRKYAREGITPHKLRHSYATELYNRSKNLRVVQENLGHASIMTTEIYLHTDMEERRKAYEDSFPLGKKNNHPDIIHIIDRYFDLKN